MEDEIGKSENDVYGLCVTQNMKDGKGKTDQKKGRNNIKMNERKEMVIVWKESERQSG